MFIHDVRSFMLDPVLDGLCQRPSSNCDVPFAFFSKFERCPGFRPVSQLEIEGAIPIVIHAIYIESVDASDPHLSLPDKAKEEMLNGAVVEFPKMLKNRSCSIR
jgi:hypothetical protein